jgi:hypothetical protein
MENNLEKIRHSLSHLMSMAVQEIYPEAGLGVGPTIEKGFYQDYDLPEATTPDLLPKLERRIRELIKENIKFEQHDVDFGEAYALYKNDPYKTWLIDELKERGEKKVSFYRSGNFDNLCAGPHVASTDEIPRDAFRLTHIAGAYWKGSEKNKMLTRIYGVAFANKKELDDYLEMMAEAEKRDHRKLAKDLDLFMISEEELSAFVNMFQIFIGVLFNESKTLFVKTENTMIQHDPIQDHGDFYQTNLLWTQLCQKKETLKTILNEENYTILDKHFTHIQKIFDNVVTVFKKMYGNSDFYFTYSEAQKFTDWKEFVDVFTNKVIFFSNTNTQLAKPIPEYQSTTTTQQKISVVPPVVDTLVNYVVNQCEKSDGEISYFIFSPKKEESKKIFEDLCKNHIHDKVTLLVENITGGIGKNIFKAKQSKNKIII